MEHAKCQRAASKRQSREAMPAGTEGFVCMLMALGTSGWVGGAMVGRFPPVNNEDKGYEVDVTAGDASERVSTAARLPVRETTALDSTSRTRDYQSRIGMQGLAWDARACKWCACRVSVPTRRRQSAQRRRPDERSAGGRGCAASAWRAMRPSYLLRARSRAPTASTTWVTGRPTISMGRRRPRAWKTGSLHVSEHKIP